ncbi:uncharacterized protein L969DRAFT_46888 [Mixia osmundae IAM 14324]|uniref:Ubiquitin 3 binding protein But2 C-terminal domain-containing protein n=1 Tax=Mixia osmundae (strain CBS 9802 / IAM 14324 / JCM 22182 / KY 12970) TaxID=764103 RepID=G7E5Q2_MIXOS|nr:uncharacterized protein L969DRAFT_46888 [Mixia osmundae IAM 14324]KEI40688.1 hypothetical protein L969DRAFT_46888 [Mixia osmundae IAM 14324]GAA98162.1 hypothetical protein E5Q_04845 [Mixia osmundae IAM 14324]
MRSFRLCSRAASIVWFVVGLHEAASATDRLEAPTPAGGRFCIAFEQVAATCYGQVALDGQILPFVVTAEQPSMLFGVRLTLDPLNAWCFAGESDMPRLPSVEASKIDQASPDNFEIELFAVRSMQTSQAFLPNRNLKIAEPVLGFMCGPNTKYLIPGMDISCAEIFHVEIESDQCEFRYDLGYQKPFWTTVKKSGGCTSTPQSVQTF